MKTLFTSYLVLLLAVSSGAPVALSAGSYYGSVDTSNSKTPDSDSVAGAANYTNVERESLSISGSLTFSNLTVTRDLSVAGNASGNRLTCNKLSISGALNGDHISCEKLEVTGSLKAEDLKVSGTANVSGKIALDNSSIDALSWGAAGELALVSTPFLAHNSTFNQINVTSSGPKSWNLFFVKVSSTASCNKILLTGSSVVTGDVLFEKEGGVVELHDTAQVKGKVINGTITHK